MKPTLLEAICKKVVLADGAIGTELQRRGLQPGSCCEIWNLEHPEKVAAVHTAYVDAGAQLLTTNTFRANRIALTQFGAEDRLAEINRAAVRIAREAAGGRAYVMGSVGPLGGFIEPLGEISIESAYEAFLEQTRTLVNAGVDALIIETMTAVEEIEIAIRAARKAGAPVVIASMAFDKVRDGYRTMMGVTIQQAVEAMTRENADVIGCNCGAGLTLDGYAEIVRQMRALSDKPIVVEPNAGQPELRNGEIVYTQSPNKMAEKMDGLISAGANTIGGCCGTTPEHIAQIDAAVFGR